MSQRLTPTVPTAAVGTLRISHAERTAVTLHATAGSFGHPKSNKSEAYAANVERRLVPHVDIVEDVAACIPTSFDDNYCDWDRFYFLGIGLTSAVIGMFSQSAVVSLGTLSRIIQGVLGGGTVSAATRWASNNDRGFLATFTRAIDVSLKAAEMPQDRLAMRNAVPARYVTIDGVTKLVQNEKTFTDDVWDASLSPVTYMAGVSANMINLIESIISIILSPVLGTITPEMYEQGKALTTPSQTTEMSAVVTMYGLVAGTIYKAPRMRLLVRAIAENTHEISRAIASFFRYNHAKWQDGTQLYPNPKKYVELVYRDLDPNTGFMNPNDRWNVPEEEQRRRFSPENPANR